VADFSYQLAINVAKQLPAIADPLVDVDFCSSTGATQSPPTLRFSVAANGTASIEGVLSDCKSIGVGTGTNPTTLLAATPFGTNADSAYMLITEVSGNTAAFATVYAVDGTSKNTFSTINAQGTILIRQPPSVGYAAASSNAAATARLQIVLIGE
jgi:hypothetical protein